MSLTDDEKLKLVDLKQQQFLNMISRSEFVPSNNYVACADRETKNDCTPPIFDPDESANKVDILMKTIEESIPSSKADKILGFDKGDISTNYEKYFNSLISEHEIAKTTDLQQKINDGKKIAELVWGEKQEFFNDYASELLMNINDSLEIINEGKAEAEKIGEQPDSTSIFKTKGELTDLYGLVKKYSHDFGGMLNDYNMCEWHPDGYCKDFEIPEEVIDEVIAYEEETGVDIIDDLGGCPTCAPSEGDCPSPMFDTQLFEAGGFKITVGIVLFALTAKLFMDVKGFRKQLNLPPGTTGIGF